jgi:hypothetical protein
MKTNDYPLGSTFEHNGIALLVAEDRRDLGCNDCWFGDMDDDEKCKVPHCTGKYRADGKDVVFVKLPEHGK